MEIFELGKLRQTLHSLPSWKRVVFMVSCCERMLPNYQSFSSEAGYGNANLLREALDRAWDWIEGGRLPNNMATLIAECEQQAPDTSEFDSIYTSAALDAANSIAETLEALGEATEDQAIEVASLARDTVDLFVQQQQDLDPNSPGLEKEIIESRLMQDELRHQRQCLEELKDRIDERSLIAAEMRSRFAGLKEGSLPHKTVPDRSRRN